MAYTEKDDESEQFLTPSYSEISEAVRKATNEYGLCRDRVWAVARSHPQKENVLPYLMKRRVEEPMNGHRDHDQCEFGFCEHSQLDFTKVAQRHESKACADYPCKLLRNHFPRATLEEATKSKKLTAWALNGRSMIKPPLPFMAISHVWSDGTGAGANWSRGEVNRCLYDYFKGIAERFQCHGIWWDAICIPEDKAARSIAINRMHVNYEEARFTLVHDCYLREWEWFDAETACFAIIMSPWFSRGWTALELAQSRKVKVIFKDSVIKDLDEDILANPQSIRHQIGSELISNLRQGTVTTVNDLLQVLHSRSTSWRRDMAIISALLAKVPLDSNASQKKIYQDILRKIGRVSHDQLFHKSPTMSDGFGWCPASLLDMHISPTEPMLHVLESGGVVGPWRVIHRLGDIPPEIYHWKDIHAMVVPKLRLAVQDPDNHLLLAEPATVTGFQENADLINRALLVKRLDDSVYQLVGSLYLQSPLDISGRNEGPVDVTICHGNDIGNDLDETHNKVKSSRQPNLQKQRTVSPDSNNEEALLWAAEKGDHDLVQLLLQNGTHHSPRDGEGQTPLFHAVINGHKETAKILLEQGANPNVKDNRSWTVLHHVSWLYLDGVEVDLLERCDCDSEDRLGQRAIHLAADRGNQEIIAQLLSRGANPNAQCDYGQTALHRAAFAGSVSIVRHLLSKNANPKIQDFLGQIPMHLAAKYGYKEVVKQLIKASPDGIDRVDGQGCTPLHLAAQVGDKVLVQLFLEKGATSLGLSNNEGWRPLHLAAEGGYETTMRLLQEVEGNASCSDTWKLLHAAVKGDLEDIIRELLRENSMDLYINPAELHADSRQRRLPLHVAAERGRERAARLLLQEGASISVIDDYGRPALLVAATHGHAGVVKLLLEYGADVNATDCWEMYSALDLAVDHDHESVVRLLLERGASLKPRGTHNPLLNAIRNGHRDVVELLLKNGSDVNATSGPSSRQLGATEPLENLPLFAGIQHRQIETVELLLQNGASITKTNSNGKEPIEYAIHMGCEEIVNLLLENGAKVDAEYTSGWTPLLQAAFLGSPNIVRLLLAKGANIEVENNLKRTSLYISVHQGHKDVVELLLQKGCNVDPIRDGETPLLSAAKHGHTEIIMLLLKSGADIEAQDAVGETPLFAAISHGHKDAVKVLLDSGAACHVIYNFGVNPLSTIIQNGHEDIAKLLIEKGHCDPGFIEALVLWWSTPFAKIVVMGTAPLLLLICLLLEFWLEFWFETGITAVLCLMLCLIVVVHVLGGPSKDALREGEDHDIDPALW
uniref:Ankyrin-3 n=1 Tax=Talaromyces marneffei PM1 TaxID=1077442 RepID=A0A093VTE0_TALMA